MSEVLDMTAIINAKEGLADELAAELPEFEKLTNEEPGCLAFQFFRDVENPNRFILWESFVNPAALTEHMQLEHVKALFSKGLIANTTVIKHKRLA